jgi:hypothetical protein
MHSSSTEGSCWPTRQQELLLRASLLQGTIAAGAWEEWISGSDIDDLDQGSYRLLPLLYHNLQNQKVKHPLMGKLKGIYLSSWYRNQILFHHLVALLKGLTDAGIETMLLKGAALIIAYYNNHGVRPMNDLDILVPLKKAQGAVKVLMELGWNPTVTPLKGFAEIDSLSRFGWKPKARQADQFTEVYLSVRHAHDFVGPDGHVCDLHWHLLEGYGGAERDEEFWHRAVRVNVRDLSTHALNATDQLFHVCVHGAKWNPVPPLRWISDAVTILRRSQTGIDWDRIMALGQRHDLILPLKDTLSYLRHYFAIPLPETILKKMDSIPISNITRLDYRVRTRSPRFTDGLLHLYYLYKHYAREENSLGSSTKLARFGTYLQNIFGMDQLWQLPLYAAFEIIRRTRWAVGSFGALLVKLVKHYCGRTQQTGG